MQTPTVETLMRIFQEFDRLGLIKDTLCFDPEHLFRTVIIDHWKDNYPTKEQIHQAYKDFDEFYEQNELPPYDAAFKYFEAGVDFALKQSWNNKPSKQKDATC